MEKILLKHSIDDGGVIQGNILLVGKIEQLKERTIHSINGLIELSNESFNDFLHIIIFDMEDNPNIKKFLVENRKCISSFLVGLLGKDMARKDTILALRDKYPFLDIFVVDDESTIKPRIGELILRASNPEEMRNRLSKLIQVIIKEIRNMEEKFRKKGDELNKEFVTVKSHLQNIFKKEVEWEGRIQYLKKKGKDSLTNSEKEIVGNYQKFLVEKEFYQKMLSDLMIKQKSLIDEKREELQFYAILKNLVEVELKNIEQSITINKYKGNIGEIEMF